MIHIEVVGRITKSRSRKGKYGNMYTPKETESTENLIKWIFANKYPKFKPLETPIRMRIVAYFIKAKKNTMPCPMLKPDADNTAKICCDALNRLAYLDDKQITSLTIEKEWSDRERVEMFIEPIHIRGAK